MNIRKCFGKLTAAMIFSVFCIAGLLLSCNVLWGAEADQAPTADPKAALAQTEDAIVKLEASITTMKSEIAKIEASSDTSVWGPEHAATIKNDLTKDMKMYLPQLEEQLKTLKALKEHLASTAGGDAPNESE